jgi:hypothetical protein
MDIEYGAEVIDQEGNALGTVDYAIRNSWTGEISKFRVRRDPSGGEFMLSPEEILESAETRIKVDVSSDGLNDMH